MQQLFSFIFTLAKALILLTKTGLPNNRLQAKRGVASFCFSGVISPACLKRSVRCPRARTLRAAGQVFDYVVGCIFWQFVQIDSFAFVSDELAAESAALLAPAAKHCR